MCDKCGARAVWRLMMPGSGNLEFCNHDREHFRDKFPARALVIKLDILNDPAVIREEAEMIAKISNFRLPRWPMSG